MSTAPERRSAPRYVTVRRRVERLLRLLGEHEEVIILTHNDPDPDGIAASWGLSWLLRRTAGIRSTMMYSGIIGRAENRAMVELLEIPLSHAESAELDGATPVLLVDAQPGTGNNILPPSIVPLAIIDHHPPHPSGQAAAFRDVRTKFGATATIVTRYLWAMGEEPPPRLATALFYGIKSDTLGLSRSATRSDALVYLYLHERADLPIIGEIENAQLSKDYFVVMGRALRTARIYKDVVVSTLGELQHADMPAEVADLLMRLRGARWVLCAGTFNNLLVLSLRTNDESLNAGRVIQELVRDSGNAGGHATMAGGRVPYKGGKRIAQAELVDRFLQLMKLTDVEGESLLSR